MNTQSGEAPLLFDAKWFQLWTDVYQKYYGQSGGWMAGLVLLSFNIQFGQGRNSFTFTIMNFGVTMSWNARRVSKVVEMPNKGPQVQMMCAVCSKPATAVTPICVPCMTLLMDKPHEN